MTPPTLLGLRVLGLALATVLSLTPTWIGAATIRLDDAGSHPMPPNVQMQWRELGATGPGSAKHMEAQLAVAIRLDTRPHAGRQARVYMVLPHDGGAALTVQWNTQGRLLPGRIGPGERTLVYQGVLPDKTLEDRLQLYLMVNGEWMASSRRLEFYFELDMQ